MATRASSTPDLWATLRRNGDGADIVARRTFAASPADVWDAITDPTRLGRWFAPTELHQDTNGTGYTVTFDPEDDTQTVRGTVTECDAPHRLSATWGIRGEPETKVEVELTADGDATRFQLIHLGFLPEPAANYAAGWQAHLEDLQAFVTDAADPGDFWKRFESLAPAYRDQAADL